MFFGFRVVGVFFMSFCRVLSRQISNFPDIVLVDLLIEDTPLKFGNKMFWQHFYCISGQKVIL